MKNGQRLEKFEDFQTCRLFNFNVDVELIDKEKVIDSGVIERIEHNYIVMNGKNYNTSEHIFFYRPFPNEESQPV